VYDASDLSTLYLDAAGTTAATVNGLVGLQLDKSAGLAVSSSAELVTNGTFPTDTSGWTLSSGTASVTQGAGGMTVLATVTATVSQAITTVVGKNYRYSVEITANNAAAFLAIRKADNATASVNIVDLRANSNGVSVGYFTATATTTYIVVQANTSASITVDNISLVEWYAGNHRYQTTTGSKPILRGSPVGANLVTNGDFASGTAGWTGTNATLSNVSNRLRATVVAGGAVSRATWTLSTTASKTYRITAQYATDSVTSNTSIYVGTVDGVADLLNIFCGSTTGTYVGYFTATGATAYIALSTTATLALAGEFNEWDNIEIVDVSAGQVQAPYWLQYDGVDDFLLTAAVDFTATDKMFVCAGVRKLSDAAEGIFIELSANANLNNGSFIVEAPRTAGVGNYGFFSKGTVLSGTNVATYAAPVTNIVAGIFDIAGDSILVRVNGSQVGTSVTDQGTGNFGNHILYFGRRGGIGTPFTGLESRTVICGKTLSATELASTERWVNQQTLAY
jgi:hypothetical protein